MTRWKATRVHSWHFRGTLCPHESLIQEAVKSKSTLDQIWTVYRRVDVTSFQAYVAFAVQTSRSSCLQFCFTDELHEGNIQLFQCFHHLCSLSRQKQNTKQKLQASFTFEIIPHICSSVVASAEQHRRPIYSLRRREAACTAHNSSHPDGVPGPYRRSLLGWRKHGDLRP